MVSCGSWNGLDGYGYGSGNQYEWLLKRLQQLAGFKRKVRWKGIMCVGGPFQGKVQCAFGMI